MPASGEDVSSNDGNGSTSESTVDEGAEGYSRRGFMETAGAVAGAGAATGLAGCLGDDVGGNGEPDFLWWTMRGYIPEEQQALEDIAEEFEDYSDDPVNLSTTVITWDSVFEEWAAAIQGQNTPNVSEMANEHAVDYGDQGVVRENTDLFEQYDDWYDTPAIWGLYEDQKWGFPWFIEIRHMYANMDILDEVGIDSVPETWSDLINDAMEISDETDYHGYGSGAARDTGTGQALYSTATQNGAEWFDYDEDADEWEVTMDDSAALFAHLWYASMQEEWDIVPGGWAGMEGTDIEQLYREGDVAFILSGGDTGRELVEDDHDLLDSTEVFMTPEGPNGERSSFMGGSCLSAFTEDFTQHDSGNEFSMEFIDYMTQPDTMNEYFPEATPTFLPVREAQEEIEPFTENTTDIPDDWIDVRLEQADDSKRYGITGGERSAPFLGALEGDVDGYSIAISAILGADEDPKEAIVTQGNRVREELEGRVDYDVPENTEEPDLDDAPDIVQDWINGDNDTPQIWNPYD